MGEMKAGAAIPYNQFFFIAYHLFIYLFVYLLYARTRGCGCDMMYT